jgi:hypothetical protein
MEELFQNWQETKGALLEGLDAKKQAIVAPLLENQKNQLLAENAAGGAGVTQAHDIAGFRKILIPMIRRIIPGTIATELVGVQPMAGPVGLVYTLRYRYAENVTGDASRNPFGAPNDIAAGDEVFGNVSPIRHFYSGAVEGGSPYTGEDAGASGIGAGSEAPGDITAATAQGSAWPSSMPSYDTDGDTGFPGFGPHADPGSAGETGTNSSGDRAADYFRSVAGTLRGGSGSFLEGSGGRKMTLDVVSQAVEAGSRKLQAGWTIEAMQDLNSQHGLDLESEMTQALSAEIVQEIDFEIISDLLALAGTVETFDGAATSSYTTNYTPTYVGDRLANLGVIVNRVANEIGRKTRRGVGNFMVVSPLLVSVLQSAAKSVFAPAVEGAFKGPNNTMLVGTLNGQIKVYSYLWNQAGAGTDLSSPLGSPLGSSDDVALVGYKGGNGETDSGYFYCPYIPLMSSGVVIHPTTFQPVVSLMTRYGKGVFVNANTSLGNSSDYYGKIKVLNLDLR